jgi:hypothetical protein
MVSIPEKLKALGFAPAQGLGNHTKVPASPLTHALPAEYVDFLATYGGGDFETETVVRCKTPPPQANDGLCLFGEFFGVGVGESSLLTAWTRGDELVSAEMLPIASAAGGDVYCLAWGTAEAEVVYWAHDSGDSYTVADSFPDFICRLEAAREPPSTDLGRIKLKLDPDLL